MIYEYVTKTGQMARVEAANPQEAIAKAPNIDPHSGVSVVQGTNTSVSTTPSLPSLPNQNKKTLPIEPAQPTQKTLPEVPSNSSRLLSFSGLLNEAVNLARDKRMRAISGVISEGVPEGVRSASDLSGLMRGLNEVNNSFVEPLVQTATRAYEGDLNDITAYATSAAQNGAPAGVVNQILNSKNPGQALVLATPYLNPQEKNEDSGNIKQIATAAAQNGAPPDVITQILASDSYSSALIAASPYIQKETDTTGDGNPIPTQKSLYSGSLTYTPTDISQGVQKLENSKGEDGYVDPTIYLNMYKTWISKGGLPQDFTKQYPPKMYVNPANTWLPANLKSGTGSYTIEDDQEIINPFK